jgi:hypothetical protein
MAAINEEIKRAWSQYMQRRVMRLLLRHDQRYFRGNFRQFYAKSELPVHPVLQQYDRYLKLMTQCDELLDDIMPRIRRQLSLSTSSAHLRELAPVQGEIDWVRTLERNMRAAPGLQPLFFETHLRQRNTLTRENLLTVAILLETRQELQELFDENLEDESLALQELEVLTSIDERIERELAAPYARALLEEAQHVEVAAFIAEVENILHPGPNPYRDLLSWRERLVALRVGRTRAKDESHTTTLASQRADPKLEAWLYELWIALEFLHVLTSANALDVERTHIDCDHLQFGFIWSERAFCFCYNRQRSEANAWVNAPSFRPDYTIERAKPDQIRIPPEASDDELVWSEPPVVLDAKYYVGDKTHGELIYEPVKKLLADMVLISAPQVILFFPTLLLEAHAEQPFARIVKHRGVRHHAGWQQDQEIRLCELTPGQKTEEEIQVCLHAVLDHAIAHLPERPQPACEGVPLNMASINASGHINSEYNSICPKRHIGANVFDLVHTERHCLRDRKLCHVIGQTGVFPPRIISVSTRSELQEETRRIRAQYEMLLHQGEADEQDRLCLRLLDNVGQMVEQYVARRGSTKAIEDTFRNWIFHRYWDQEAWALAAETRKMLVSGEYVWYEYQESTLDDWAAPAIQYCRALEYEVRRRFYQRHATHFVFRNRQVWTLGTLEHLHKNRQRGSRDDQQNWHLVVDCITRSAAPLVDFEAILDRFVNERVVHKRNELAHGAPIARPIAEALRQTILGDRSQMGILSWLVEHVEPI